jgi:hypothetical protein
LRNTTVSGSFVDKIINSLSNRKDKWIKEADTYFIEGREDVGLMEMGGRLLVVLRNESYKDTGNIVGEFDGRRSYVIRRALRKYFKNDEPNHVEKAEKLMFGGQE